MNDALLAIGLDEADVEMSMAIEAMESYEMRQDFDYVLESALSDIGIAMEADNADAKDKVSIIQHIRNAGAAVMQFIERGIQWIQAKFITIVTKLKQKGAKEKNIPLYKFYWDAVEDALKEVESLTSEQRINSIIEAARVSDEKVNEALAKFNADAKRLATDISDNSESNIGVKNSIGADKIEIPITRFYQMIMNFNTRSRKVMELLKTRTKEVIGEADKAADKDVESVKALKRRLRGIRHATSKSMSAFNIAIVSIHKTMRAGGLETAETKEQNRNAKTVASDKKEEERLGKKHERDRIRQERKEARAAKKAEKANSKTSAA